MAVTSGCESERLRDRRAVERGEAAHQRRVPTTAASFTRIERSDRASDARLRARRGTSCTISSARRPRAAPARASRSRLIQINVVVHLVLAGRVVEPAHVPARRRSPPPRPSRRAVARSRTSRNARAAARRPPGARCVAASATVDHARRRPARPSRNRIALPRGCAATPSSTTQMRVGSQALRPRPRRTWPWISRSSIAVQQPSSRGRCRAGRRMLSRPFCCSRSASSIGRDPVAVVQVVEQQRQVDAGHDHDLAAAARRGRRRRCGTSRPRSR